MIKNKLNNIVNEKSDDDVLFKSLIKRGIFTIFIFIAIFFCAFIVRNVSTLPNSTRYFFSQEKSFSPILESAFIEPVSLNGHELQLGRKKIKDIVVGDRALGINPEIPVQFRLDRFFNSDNSIEGSKKFAYSRDEILIQNIEFETVDGVIASVSSDKYLNLIGTQYVEGDP
jgi:hypothetical protein